MTRTQLKIAPPDLPAPWKVLDYDYYPGLYDKPQGAGSISVELKLREERWPRIFTISMLTQLNPRSARYRYVYRLKFRNHDSIGFTQRRNSEDGPSFFLEKFLKRYFDWGALDREAKTFGPLIIEAIHTLGPWIR